MVIPELLELLEEELTWPILNPLSPPKPSAFGPENWVALLKDEELAGEACALEEAVWEVELPVVLGEL